MREVISGYPTSDERVDATERPPTAALDVLGAVGRVAATALQPPQLIKRRQECDFGGLPRRPKTGGKGIAGVRADILAGKYTVREVSMMPVSEIKRRYRVCNDRARDIRAHIAKYGVDGKSRLLSGMPRSLVED